MPTINPEILVWARESAGISLAGAAHKLGIRDSRGIDAIGRLQALESGDEEPTRSMLLKMAHHYHRPLLTFYLTAPPRRGHRGADFRSLRTSQRRVDTEAIIDALIRDIQARQGMLRAALEDEEEPIRRTFVGSASITEGKQSVLELLRVLLNLELREYRRQTDESSAFELLRRRVGQLGIFVLLKGDLGSHHSALDVEVFRGFSLSDELAPFIVINDGDSRAAWSFTLLHELVHILLGQTGISAGYLGNDIEVFCNEIAGEFLLPDEEVHRIDLNGGETLEQCSRIISDFARLRKLSHTMVAYRAHRSGVIDQDKFAQLAALFQTRWQETRASTREVTNEQSISYYIVRRHRVGSDLLGLVKRMLSTGTLTTSRAARILDVKPTGLQALIGE